MGTGSETLADHAVPLPEAGTVACLWAAVVVAAVVAYESTSGGPRVSLPVSLFGGDDKAARGLQRLTFTTDTYINAPHWLLGGITEFTTGADLMLLQLLETLRAMP
jgi:hypothetical protein